MRDKNGHDHDKQIVITQTKAYGPFSTMPCVDEHRSADNCSHNALFISQMVYRDLPIAIPLNLGNGTLFHISFLSLSQAVPFNTGDFPGATGGIQINIDRKGSYALPKGNAMQEHTYLAEKWNISEDDAKRLRLFINTVITGEDHFKEFGKDIMHRLVAGKSSKQEYWDEVYSDDDTGLDTESEEA